MDLLGLLGLDVLFKGSNALRLLGGLWVAVRISLISVAFSIVGGLLFGIFMTWKNPVAKIISRLYLEVVRIMPQLVLLFIVFFGGTRALGLNIDAELSAIVVFSFWGIGEMGDLVRGALESIPKHQYEAAEALGLNRAQMYRHVVIPQAVRRLIPMSINLVTRMIKTTSLIMMIGVVEVMKVGQQIIEANRMTSPNAVFGIYGIIFLLYFLACWPISKLGEHLERRWAA